MPNHPKPEKQKSQTPSENIQVPPIPKQTAGAVTGAAIGSIAGPVGAMVGGVVGALGEKQLPPSGQFERLLNVPKPFQNVHENDIR